MGTFASLLQKTGAEIREVQKEQFRKRIEKLFQAGGMMELENVQLYGKKVVTMKKATMHDYGMDFYYNYFEDACWENAGFCSKSVSVWSEKIGWREFHQVVVAAYVLESLYIDGPAAAIVDGNLIKSKIFVGWINYLFQEHYQLQNNDPWELFEALHDEMNVDLDEYNWSGFVWDLYGLIRYYEIKAVLLGTDAADEEFDRLTDFPQKDGARNFFDYFKRLKAAVRKYYEESERENVEQISLIMEVLHAFYEQEKSSLNICKKYEDENLTSICYFVALTDASAFTVKVIAEIYEVDFWTLWDQIRDVARNFCLYKKKVPQETISVSTMDFLGITSDDMILFWGCDINIQFSQELKDWFADLKGHFEKIMETEDVVNNSLHWILDLMEYADENYYRVYTFSDFFQETMENLNDRRFWALWKMYDEMLHDPEMEKAGSVIFVPEGPEYEHVGLHYYGTQPRRRLKRNWDIMKKDEKNNKARVTFRRYMALLENKKLRKEVFGF